MTNKLDLADAQFIGFSHGRGNRYDIIGLVSSMGLTEKEYIKLKAEYSTYYLTESDYDEIDEYFAKKTKMI